MADMSPQAVVDRLRVVSSLRRVRLDQLEPVDMSPEAIRARLRTVAQLSDLCQRLGEGTLPPDEGSAP